MTETITAQQMLDAFKLDAPGHIDGTRWAHTHGIGVVQMSTLSSTNHLIYFDIFFITLCPFGQPALMGLFCNIR